MGGKSQPAARVAVSAAAIFVAWVSALLAQGSAVEPDVAEPGSEEWIREYTTEEKFLPPSVAYLPDSDTVPSPTEHLGRLVGAPGELSRVEEIHGYFRRLADASPRVQVQQIGTSEEGREILLAVVSDVRHLQDLDRYRAITAALADPRTTAREEMERLAAEGRPFYYLLGGLHSPETGSPEMLMELAYRLAVSERGEIRRIRERLVVLITPVVEPDGRDRQVEWYYRHLRDRDLGWEELREFGSPPYWGYYVFHDNNRDGMQLTQALSRAVNETYHAFHPQVVHDLHESVPLLYISTGHGPYSPAMDPVTINERAQMAHYEAGALQSMGLPGVWTWGFWDGWWPGYLVSLADNHNSLGRFYETFGNSVAATLERELDDSRFIGKPVTEVQWYRPWPPDEKVTWSLRNNVNYMQAAVLEALSYASLHDFELLQSFWIKGQRGCKKGQSEAPYAWIFPLEQPDPGRLQRMVNLLRRHRIEVHRLTRSWSVGERLYEPGSFVVPMNQPYRNAAVNFLERQEFPADEPNPPYDDVAWTWPLLLGVEAARIDDPSVLEGPMEMVEQEIHLGGAVEGQGEIFLLRDTGQNAVFAARVRLADRRVEAAEEAFDSDGGTYGAGSWILEAPRPLVEATAAATGLTFRAVSQRPEVSTHELDLPRLAVLHTWTSTQDCGWVRYTLDREGISYTLINPEDLKEGGLGWRFDVILFPNSRGSLAEIVHGIDPRWGPLPYTTTAEYPSHGIPDASPDITGGMGFQGLGHLQEFVERGGVLITLANAGVLAVDGGMVRRVERVAKPVKTPGSELVAKVVQEGHPVTYGYPAVTSVFRGNGPLYRVPERERQRVVVQFGLREPDDGDDSEPGEPTEELVLSGFVEDAEALDGKPAILDVPVGRGRVLLFAFNPLHRYLNLSDFRFLYNAILNWNDLPGQAD